eukprot:TRINITY_DN5085_c0_g1_i16.p1 TRINITY_DN5085_c0_g1~~TRINITY_DN5085_c0_g1_i16.p1  ORF type:complete len:336 (-),score=47.99 TRINITY_DN5085_c0_g1_i16:93-1070(-)
MFINFRFYGHVLIWLSVVGILYAPPRYTPDQDLNNQDDAKVTSNPSVNADIPQTPIQPKETSQVPFSTIVIQKLSNLPSMFGFLRFFSRSNELTQKATIDDPIQSETAQTQKAPPAPETHAHRPRQFVNYRTATRDAHVHQTPQEEPTIQEAIEEGLKTMENVINYRTASREAVGAADGQVKVTIEYTGRISNSNSKPAVNYRTALRDEASAETVQEVEEILHEENPKEFVNYRTASRKVVDESTKDRNQDKSNDDDKSTGQFNNYRTASRNDAIEDVVTDTKESSENPIEDSQDISENVEESNKLEKELEEERPVMNYRTATRN